MPAGLLAAVLQGVQAERHEVGRLLHAEDAEDAAFLAQLVVVVGVGGQGHGRCFYGLPGLYRGRLEECHQRVWPLQLQLCVRRSYWPANHCGASSGSIAAIRASSPEKTTMLWLLSTCATPPAPPKTRV